MKTSDQPIEVGVGAQLEVEYSSHLVEEGEVGPEEEMPLSLLGSAKLSSEVGPTPEAEEM